MTGSKPMLLVAAAALVDTDGRVLICQRPGGKQHRPQASHHGHHGHHGGVTVRKEANFGTVDGRAVEPTA